MKGVCVEGNNTKNIRLKYYHFSCFQNVNKMHSRSQVSISMSICISVHSYLLSCFRGLLASGCHCFSNSGPANPRSGGAH